LIRSAILNLILELAVGLPIVCSRSIGLKIVITHDRL
jgi:hypothetical protein